SAVFRILPAFLEKFALNKSSTFINFLDYAGCAAIGGVIYITAFPVQGNVNINITYSPLSIINALILIISFYLSLRFRKPVVTFIVCILIYAAMISVFI
ncbi:MAG: hypothetical protein V4496_02345, partial [Pseudomonadota bacterium]